MPIEVEKVRNSGILFSMSFMLIGFVTGIFRLFKDNSGFDLTVLAPLYHLHSLFMVFGFLGGLLMTERIVGSRGIPGAYGTSFSFPMLLASTIGLLLLTMGWPLHNLFIAEAGGILFALSSLLFTIMLLRLGRIAHDYSSFGIMAAGTISLGLSSLISGLRLPVDDYPLILQMLLFPMIFVLGERVELSKFQYFPYKKLANRLVLIVLSVSVSLTFISSVFWTSNGQLSELLLSSALACLLIASFITFAIERKRKQYPARTSLQAYVDKGILIAYFWLFLGVLLFLLRVIGITGLYDAAIHSIALGFIVTFIFAHGPVIFPTVLGRKVNIGRLSFLPIVTLTLSNCMRVFGDMFKLPLPFPAAGIQAASTIVSLSSIILAIGAIQFAVMMKNIVSANEGERLNGP